MIRRTVSVLNRTGLVFAGIYAAWVAVAFGTAFGPPGFVIRAVSYKFIDVSTYFLLQFLGYFAFVLSGSDPSWFSMAIAAAAGLVVFYGIGWALSVSFALMRRLLVWCAPTF